MTLPIGTMVLVVREDANLAVEPPYITLVGKIGTITLAQGTYPAVLNGISLGFKSGYGVRIPAYPGVDWLMQPWQIVPIIPPGAPTEEDVDVDASEKAPA